jgi:hypothetical protein
MRRTHLRRKQEIKSNFGYEISCILISRRIGTCTCVLIILEWKVTYISCRRVLHYMFGVRDLLFMRQWWRFWEESVLRIQSFNQSESQTMIQDTGERSQPRTNGVACSSRLSPRHPMARWLAWPRSRPARHARRETAQNAVLCSRSSNLQPCRESDSAILPPPLTKVQVYTMS